MSLSWAWRLNCCSVAGRETGPDGEQTAEGPPWDICVAEDDFLNLRSYLAGSEGEVHCRGEG